MKLNDKLYDVLKWVAMIVLDAVGLCYATLADIWGWGYGNEIVRTCAAISILLGALIGLSTTNYNKLEK